MNKYPYTDFHELNADWLLKEVKDLEQSVSVLRRAVDQLAQSGSGEVQQEIEQLQQDVSNIINDLLDKVDKVTGKGLSSNDFTDADATKLASIQSGAEVNVQADWDESNPDSDAYILNKPAITPGASKNIWYATCDTAAGTAAKAAATDTADFVLTAGNMVRVKFTNANTYNGTATLNVDGTGAKSTARIGSTLTTRYYWTAGEVVDFVYDGTNFIMSNKGTAGTTYYGLTKLSSAVNSTSEALAATPKAVKTVNDALAGKVDAVAGMGLSSNDYTDADAAIVAGTADYVTSQGTSGNWRYRTWNSGLKELWLGRTFATIPANSDHVDITVTLPITITTLHSITFGSWQNTGSAVNASIWDMATLSGNVLTLHVFRNYTDTANWAISPGVTLYIIGV